MMLYQKIRISNILMVLIPIIISFLGVLLIAKTSMGNYWTTLEKMYLNENGIQSAQNLIYTYKIELWEKDWERMEFNPTENMTNLERTLSDMGYGICIKMNGNQLYSTISDEDMKAAEEAAGSGLYTAKMLTASQKNVSVIKYTFYQGENICSIIVVNNNRTEQAGTSYLKAYILKYMCLFAAIFFLLVIILNLVLSYWITGSVLKPLQKLSNGAKEIRDGNLDYEISYEKRDELGMLCQDFNEMRLYLKKSVEQRLEFEQRRRELIIGISHDLRTPLTSIKGYLEGLLDGIASTEEMRQRYLQAIKIRTQDLERLVESLSTYNRLETPSFCYDMKETDLKRFIEDYLMDNWDRFAADRVSVEFKYNRSECLVMLDNNEWKRIFDNLFSNTIRYRKKPSSAIKITLESSEQEAELCFADDGPGVPEESLLFLFDSFYRTDEARSFTGSGSGLGLAIVMEIVKGHGGRVWAENQDGLAIWMIIPLSSFFLKKQKDNIKDSA